MLKMQRNIFGYRSTTILHNNRYIINDWVIKMLEKVKEVIENEVRPALAMDGGSIDLVSVDNGVVKVKLSGACAGCPMSQYTLVNFVEATLKEKIPEVKEVIAVDGSKERFEELLRR